MLELFSVHYMCISELQQNVSSTKGLELYLDRFCKNCLRRLWSYFSFPCLASFRDEALYFTLLISLETSFAFVFGILTNSESGFPNEAI